MMFQRREKHISDKPPMSKSFREMKHDMLCWTHCKYNNFYHIEKQTEPPDTSTACVKRASVWCGSTTFVGSTGRGKGQACCDWRSDKLVDVRLYLPAFPPSLPLSPSIPVHFSGPPSKFYSRLLQAVVAAFDRFLLLHILINKKMSACAKTSGSQTDLQ